MEQRREVASESAVQSQPETDPGKPENCMESTTTSISAPAGVFTTPVSKIDPNEMSDLTKTFTRRPAVHKDISPIPDNLMTSENPTPRPNVRANRQKTMTVDPNGLQELRRLLADAKQSGLSLDDLVPKLLNLFHTKEVENNARLAKATEQIRQLENHECNNNEANIMIYRALVDEFQMMLEELTSGAYIHVGRLEEYGYTKSNGCNGACKSAAERDTLKAELDSMHDDYGKLFDSYKKLRKVAEEQKMEYSALHEKFVEKVEEIKIIQGKMSRLREDAQKKLDQASKDMADCLRERDESLVGLKLKVRHLEMDLKSHQRELEIKKNEAAELRDICDQLMRQVEPVSDVEQ